MTVAVGLDVGGTKILCAAVELESGAVVAEERRATEPARGGAAVLADCVALVERLAVDVPPVSVGIGICELVDRQGRAASAFTIDWLGIDIAGAFRHVAPARLESDVRAAALAEARYGAARGVSEPWLYVTVGTGISCSLVIDGVPYPGARGNALIVGAPPVEQVASGLALQERAGVARAEELFGDGRLADVAGNAAAELGIALAVLANALDPALIVVGGGLGLVTDYREAAVEVMRPAIEAEATRLVPVIPAALGEQAGSIGAALIGAGSGAPTP